MGELNPGFRLGDIIFTESSVYTVEKILGAGAFGEVAECWRSDTDKMVAIKRIRDKQNILAAKEELATALLFLRSQRIVHADMKPENIMMVDHVRQPLKVKLIDFGLAFQVSASHIGAELQTLWYRAPEILLGAPFNEAIDVWSLGCIAAELLTGIPLFPGHSEAEMMEYILRTAGQPPDSVLHLGLYTLYYFYAQGEEGVFKQWTAKPHVEVPDPMKTLMDLVMMFLEGQDLDDLADFLDLLSQMLEVDPERRITPDQILQHPFLTGSHQA
ncbi:homeodomain-interacting protein kinase 2-like [Aulostomus maculatus]